MSHDLIVPEVGDGATEVRVTRWHKRMGEAVAAGEVVVEVETDKVALDLPAPVAGVVTGIRRDMGERAGIGERIGWIQAADGAEGGPVAPARLEPAVDRPVPAAPPASRGPRANWRAIFRGFSGRSWR